MRREFLLMEGWPAQPNQSRLKNRMLKIQGNIYDHYCNEISNRCLIFAVRIWDCHTCQSDFDRKCSKALEYKVGRVLAPSIESDCCGFQNDISSLVIKLF